MNQRFRQCCEYYYGLSSVSVFVVGRPVFGCLLYFSWRPTVDLLSANSWLQQTHWPGITLYSWEQLFPRSNNNNYNSKNNGVSSSSGNFS